MYKNIINKLLTITLLMIFSTLAYGEAIRHIEFASEEAKEILEILKSGAQPENIDAISRLESALDQGVRVNNDLQRQIYSYKREKDELLKLKTTLSTSLIGAIITTIIAIFGAYIKVKNSKPERDLNRLNIIEKAFELNKSGVVLPDDISRKYLVEKKLTM